MNSTPHDPASPRNVSVAEFSSPVVLTLTPVGKPSANWTLKLLSSHLELEEVAGAPPYVILRDAVMKTATLLEGMNVFALTKPAKLTFKLSPQDTATLAEWIGKPVLVKSYLKRRYGWILPIAILWVLGSMPIPGGAGNKAVSFDVVGFALGLSLIVSWAVAKWRPHPVLFLVDSIWYLLLAGRLLQDVFVNGRSKGWLVLVLFLLVLVVTGLKSFRRFRGTIIPRP